MLKKFDDPVYIMKPVLPNYDEYCIRIKELWEHRILSNYGFNVQKLEKKINEFLRIKNTIVVNNGTIALMIALKALQIKGDVIVTPFTSPATTNILYWMGIKPIFCDIDINTFNIDPNKIEDSITENTTAILAVHLYGVPCDVYRIQNIAKKYNLKVVYDAAHCFNIEVNQQPICNFGDISTISFHATKVYHTIEGGCIICDDDMVSTVRFLVDLGRNKKDEIFLPGINGKMGELDAIIGIMNLDTIDKDIKNRELLFKIYENTLKDIDGIRVGCQKPYYVNEWKHNYSYCPIIVDEDKFGINREILKGKLEVYNVFARRYFYPLCNEYYFYKNYYLDEYDLIVAKKVSNDILCLPLFSEMTLESVIHICNIIKEIKSENS